MGYLGSELCPDLLIHRLGHFLLGANLRVEVISAMIEPNLKKALLKGYRRDAFGARALSWGSSLAT